MWWFRYQRDEFKKSRLRVLNKKENETPWIWISECLWDSVKIHWITVNIAQLILFSGGLYWLNFQWIFTESQTLTDSNLEWRRATLYSLWMQKIAFCAVISFEKKRSPTAKSSHATTIACSHSLFSSFLFLLFLFPPPLGTCKIRDQRRWK